MATDGGFSPGGAQSLAGGPPWGEFVERAHASLHRAAEALTLRARPSAAVVAALGSLRSSFASIYDALDGREAPGHALRAARSYLEKAAGELAAIATDDAASALACEALGEARPLLFEAETRVPPRFAPRPRAPDLRASADLPGLHLLDRPSIEPAFRVPEPGPPEVKTPPAPPAPRPMSFGELGQASEQRLARAKAALEAAKGRAGSKPRRPSAEPKRSAEVPPGFAPKIEPALGESAFLRRRVRELFEEVVMVGLQRVPLPGDDWRSSLSLERRMLAAIDAVAALGQGALVELEPLVLDSPVKDPSRLFALTMVLGCVAGRDALAAAERVFGAWEREGPAHARAFADALKLVPHPSARALLGAYLADAEVTRRALSIEALAHRGTATVEQLARACFDGPEVASIALPAYALTGHPGSPDTIRAALGSEHPSVREAAWLAMAYGGAAATVSLLRGELGGPSAERAAPLLALVGGAHDAQALAERTARAPSPPLVRALGWAGGLGAVDLLIRLLEHENEAVCDAAAEALERLTGAGLLEEVVVEPEDIAVPDVPDPPVDDEPRRPSLAYEVSDSRDQPDEGAPETLTKPSTNAARWRAYWQANAGSFDASKRYRRGKPYTPLAGLAELEGGQLGPGERRMAQRELIIRTGAFVRFDPHDFVRSQEATLEQWRSPAQRASASPGAWPTPARR